MRCPQPEQDVYEVAGGRHVPLCAEHRLQIDAGEEWVLVAPDRPKDNPQVFMSEDLRQLNQWVVVDVGQRLQSAWDAASGPEGYWLLKLRARQRGTDHTQALTLVIPPAMFKQFGAAAPKPFE